jgi:sterol desaturase/sphingolipid hydroxylase (fatty acid hydroxylase superfamily)
MACARLQSGDIGKRMLSDVWQNLIALSDVLVGFDKNALKAFVVENHLYWFWSVLRDYLYNIRIWVYVIPPALLLQYFWPIDKNQKTFSRHFFFDALYPMLFRAVSITAVTSLIVEFYFQYLPFLNTGLLDDKPLWLQAIGVFLTLDLMFYVFHRLLHENKYLWQFHKVHRSAVELNPMTNSKEDYWRSGWTTILDRI